MLFHHLGNGFFFAQSLGADAVFDKIFSENNQRLDFARLDAVRNFNQINADFREAHAGKARAINIRILVVANQQLVFRADARDGIADRTQLRLEFAQQPKFFVGLTRRSDDRYGTGRCFLELVGNFVERRRPGGFLTAHENVFQTIGAPDPLVIQATRIAHPRGVDRVVVARRVAVNFFFARTDQNIAARRATRADTLGFLEEPGAHLETKIFRRERADRANVHGIQRIIIVERHARERRDGVVAAAIDDTERVVARDVARETNAARAENAAFRVEHDARSEVNRLGLVHLGLDEAALALAVIHRVFLQLAFAGLVADRTVERMIDEQRFEDAFAHLFHRRSLRINFHSR